MQRFWKFWSEVKRKGTFRLLPEYSGSPLEGPLELEHFIRRGMIVLKTLLQSSNEVSNSCVEDQKKEIEQLENEHSEIQWRNFNNALRTETKRPKRWKRSLKRYIRTYIRTCISYFINY